MGIDKESLRRDRTQSSIAVIEKVNSLSLIIGAGIVLVGIAPAVASLVREE